MAGIKVVAALVRCAADLLICDDIDTNRLRFADAENCRNVLPAIIGELQRRGAPDEVVMGRCRFMTDNGPAPTADAAPRDKPGIGVDVAAAIELIAPSARPATISEPRRNGGPVQAALGRCRITDSGPAPTTDPAPRSAPDRCRIPDSETAPTDSASRAKPGIGVDVAAASGSIARPAR